MSALLEPHFRSLDLPRKHVTRAWMAATISAGLTLVFSIAGALGIIALPGYDAWNLIDVVILAALAYGVWRRSRVCAVLLLLYGIANEVFLALDETARFSLLRVVSSTSTFAVPSRSSAIITVPNPCSQLRPNHAMERTADRRENLFSMTKTTHSEANPAFVSGRSSWSR